MHYVLGTYIVKCDAAIIRHTFGIIPRQYGSLMVARSWWSHKFVIVMIYKARTGIRVWTHKMWKNILSYNKKKKWNYVLNNFHMSAKKKKVNRPE